jgi:hypothetical protein
MTKLADGSEVVCGRGWAARCAHSRGSKCRCQCGGQNHGTAVQVPNAGGDRGVDPVRALIEELSAPGLHWIIERGFKYRGLWPNRPAVTDLASIWREDGVLVVVATEIADNPGASITNTIENLAEAITAKGHGPNDFILVEHYPPGRYGDPRIERSLSRVWFGSKLRNPQWSHMTLGDLAELVGADVATEAPLAGAR